MSCHLGMVGLYLIPSSLEAGGKGKAGLLSLKEIVWKTQFHYFYIYILARET